MLFRSSLFSLVGLINFLNSGEAIRYSCGGWTVPVGGEFLYDGIAAFFVLVINSVAFFVLIYSLHVSEKDLSGRKAAYYALTMLMIGRASCRERVCDAVEDGERMTR